MNVGPCKSFFLLLLQTLARAADQQQQLFHAALFHIAHIGHGNMVTASPGQVMVR